MKKTSGRARAKASVKSRAVSKKKSRLQAAKKAEKSRLKGHLISATDLSRLQESLREAQETLDAIRSGEVDAVVVNGANGNQIYSMAGAEQPYRIYVEQMQEGAVTVSSEAMILYSNQRFAEMVRRPLEKVISSNLMLYLSPAAWKEISGVFDADREAIKHVTDLRSGREATLPVTLTASRLPVEGQRMMCLVVTDLTAQHEKEKYRAGKELAEQASIAKDNFIAALSHELRTPLTPTLMAAVELEANQDLPEKVRQQLGMIRRNIELEARLIDDLLDLTRIARGKLELRLTATDVHTVLEQALAICQADILAKRLQVRLVFEAARAGVQADVVRLQQAVWNLIRNAIKFTPEGGSIEIRTGNDGPRVFIEIKDSGIGFEAEMAPKLFCAFEQGGQQITRRFGGLGLGLAITRSIVESHNGTVKGDSKGPNQGAVFTLEMPASALRGSAATAAAAGSPPATNPMPTRPMSLLLVEDHKDTRFALELILKRAGHSVQSASSAKGALDMAAEQAFDLVISDLGLPDQSGLEMMAQLRDRFGLRGIAVSGYGMDDDIARSREAGFLYHLTKPISMEILKKLIVEASRLPTAEIPA